ncbi:hypothetical protein AJ78_01427 [Emergomyces pasteurianus Ep9510]|uniref:Uncharacterized protein n=1 Tax=Emergomyces pasteurianus Ep9510 TaxID=1447872 RepID=A0A1J9PRP0_9EURO|nr:hypothetical protein AJ78_01427 [Emergomyces pasteurianus Ep9510]
MTGKKPARRQRGRPSRASVRRSDSNQHLAGFLSTPADLLKDRNSAVEKGNKDRWQKLHVQHTAQVKKTGEGIQAMAHSNKLAFMRHRRIQIKLLAELIKKRTELETEIVTNVQTLSDLFEAASGKLNTALTSRLSCLR